MIISGVSGPRRADGRVCHLLLGTFVYIPVTADRDVSRANADRQLNTLDS